MQRESKIQVQEATKKLLEMFRTGIMPEKVAFTVIQRRRGGARPCDRWSVGNQIIMYCNGTDDARGFKQWLTAGRQVRKGSKCFYIFSPKTRKIKNEQAGEEKIVLYGFKATPVFRYEDTEGEEVPEADYTPEKLPPLYDVAEKLGIKVSYSPITRPALGSYSLSSKEIKLYSQDAFVYFHELAHAVHHTFVNLKEVENARSETVAELAACVLCQLNGIKGYEDQAYKYISTYCGDAEVETILRYIMSMLNETEKIVNKIIDAAAENFSWKNS